MLQVCFIMNVIIAMFALSENSVKFEVLTMGEMTKTSVKYCRKCIYSYKHSQTEIMCGYYLQTRLRRGCPVGMCDKFEKKGRKKRVQLK